MPPEKGLHVNCVAVVTPVALFAGAVSVGDAGTFTTRLLVPAASPRRVTRPELPRLPFPSLVEMTAVSVVPAMDGARYEKDGFGKESITTGIPFVLFGIFRYLYLIYVKGQGGHPEDVILKDRPLGIAVLLWVSSAVAVLIIFRHP